MADAPQARRNRNARANLAGQRANRNDRSKEEVQAEAVRLRVKAVGSSLAHAHVEGQTLNNKKPGSVTNYAGFFVSADS